MADFENDCEPVFKKDGSTVDLKGCSYLTHTHYFEQTQKHQSLEKHWMEH